MPCYIPLMPRYIPLMPRARSLAAPGACQADFTISPLKYPPYLDVLTLQLTSACAVKAEGFAVYFLWAPGQIYP